MMPTWNDPLRAMLYSDLRGWYFPTPPPTHVDFWPFGGSVDFSALPQWTSVVLPVDAPKRKRRHKKAHKRQGAAA